MVTRLASNQPITGNCKVKLNDCRSQGSGPSCYPSGDALGKQHKEACLANTGCDQQIKRCLSDCNAIFDYDMDGTETNIWRSYHAFVWGGEGESGSGPGSQAIVYYGKPIDQIVDLGEPIPTLITYPGAETDGFSANAYVRIGNYSCMLPPGSHSAPPPCTYPAVGTAYTVLNALAECSRKCYNNFVDRCRTAHCYCGRLACTTKPINTEIFGPAADPNLGKDPFADYKNKEKSSRISDIELSSNSQYDIPIELIYSHAYMPGNVTWISPVRSEQTSFTYTTRDDEAKTITQNTIVTIRNLVDLHVSLCAGEVDILESVRVNDAFIYDRSDPTITSTTGLKLMTGTRSQKVAKELAIDQGFGKVPAYRDTAYLRVLGYDFSTSANQFPAFSVEISRLDDANDFAVTSDELPGLDTSQVFKVFPEADRVVVESTAGITVLDARTMQPVWTEDVDDVIEVTPLGKLLQYDGADVSLYEPGMEAVAGSFTPTLAISESFLLRYSDNEGQNSTRLLSFNTSGDAVLEAMDEVRPVFPDTAVEFPDFDTAPPEVAVALLYDYTSIAGTPSKIKSIFTARMLNGSPDTIRLRELRMLSSDPTHRLAADGEWYEYDIAASAFGSSTTLVLQGLVPFGGYLYIMTSDNTTHRITKWHPVEGVVWGVTVPSLPYFGRYSPVSENADGVFHYFAPNGNLYAMRTDASVTAVPMSGVPELASGGLQFYDAFTQSIIYQTSDDTIARAYIGRRETVLESIGDVVADLAKRSGLSYSHIDTTEIAEIEVTGYRTGNQETAADILASLGQVYLISYLNDDNIRFVPKSYGDEIPVDDYYARDIPKRQRRVIDREAKSVTVKYFSADQEGAESEQTFSLVQDADRFVTGAETTFDWTILEHDSYMRQLAELLAYTSESEFTAENRILPPRYLAFTVGDIALLDDKTRVTRCTIGADNTIEIETKLEDPENYDDLAPIQGVSLPVGGGNIGGLGRTLGAPMSFAMRAMLQANDDATGGFVGVSNILGEFAPPTLVGPADSEISTMFAGVTLEARRPMMWGRLHTAPPEIAPAMFRTFPNDYLEINFPTEAMAEQVVAMENRNGEFPDYRTIDRFYHNLAVGREFIQYGYAELVAPKRVRFTNLLRCRHNTDVCRDHEVGEFCAIVDNVTCRSYEIEDIKADRAAGYLTFANAQNGRRHDSDPDLDMLKPLPIEAIMRHDPKFIDPLFGIPVHDIRIMLRQRMTQGNGFDDNTTFAIGSGEAMTCQVYLLRAAYDPILFDEGRYTQNYDYFIYRHDSSADIAVIDQSEEYSGLPYGVGEDTTYNSVGLFDRGISIKEIDYFYTPGPNGPEYDRANEPLTVVVVYSNAYGEVRSIVHYPRGSQENYETRPVRGFPTYG